MTTSAASCNNLSLSLRRGNSFPPKILFLTNSRSHFNMFTGYNASLSFINNFFNDDAKLSYSQSEGQKQKFKVSNMKIY